MLQRLEHPTSKAFFTFKKEILLQHTQLPMKGWISLTSCWLEEIQEFFRPYQQVSRLSGLNLEKMREGFTFRTQRKLSVITSVIRPVLNRRSLSGVRQCTSITKIWWAFFEKIYVSEVNKHKLTCYPPKLVSSSALFSSTKLCSGEQFVRNKAESLITKILHNL